MLLLPADAESWDFRKNKAINPPAAAFQKAKAALRKHSTYPKT
jgi:hypothetical protein